MGETFFNSLKTAKNYWYSSYLLETNGVFPCWSSEDPDSKLRVSSPVSLASFSLAPSAILLFLLAPDFGTCGMSPSSELRYRICSPHLWQWVDILKCPVCLYTLHTLPSDGHLVCVGRWMNVQLIMHFWAGSVGPLSLLLCSSAWGWYQDLNVWGWWYRSCL